MSDWDDVRWFLQLNGIADAWLVAFDADGWQLRFGHPAEGSLGILPAPGHPVATLEDALWLADVLAFDHDAPVGVSPAWTGVWPESAPKDPAAVPAAQPIHHFKDRLVGWYWQALNEAYSAAAELRFNGSYVVRYADEPGPKTNFARRFGGREELVSMYAMGARQADLLTEYLCLYRILEGADGQNGMVAAAKGLPRLPDHDFGVLRVIGPDDEYETAQNAFAVYRDRALEELGQLANQGIQNIPQYLYQIRNSLAHGKREVLAGGLGEPFQQVARVVPIIKLLARMAIEP